jgi:hypothetical protein
MIEVTQKDSNGRIQTIAYYFTEEQFGKAFHPATVEENFSTEHKQIGKEETFITPNYYRTDYIFACVAYNERGNVLDVSHLVGIARQYNEWYLRQVKWYYRRRSSGTKREKRRVRGSRFRAMRTTQERKWANAWDDEEFAPKCRTRRDAKHLPNYWDEFWRYNQKNWKKFRKHQWKEK